MKRNKFLSLAMALVFTTTQTFAASIGDDNVDLGKTTSTGDKSITFKGPTSSKKLKGSQAGALGYNGNSLSIGDGANTANKTFTFDKGASSPFFQYNFSTGAIDTGNLSILNHTGNELYVGDGTNTNKVLKFNKGTSSPEIRYNSSTGKLQFTNDATTYKDIGSGSGGGGGTNLLQDFNFDFEAQNPPQNWTASGGTFVAETTDPLFGLQSGSWDSSASAQTLSSSLVTIEKGFIGKKCTADIEYKWPSGVAADLSFQVVDQVPNVLATVNLEPTTGINTRKAFLAFDCPSVATDQLRVRLLSNVANPALIVVDNAFVGVNKSTVNVSQALFAGESYWNSTASCTWSRTSATLGPVGATAACPGPTIVDSTVGTWLTTDTDLPRQTITNLPAGKYRATFWTQQSASANAATALAINDGTTTCEAVSGEHSNSSSSGMTVSCVFVYSSPQASRTFELYTAAAGGNTTTLANSNTSPKYSMKFHLEYYPLNDSQALNLETTGQSWSGYHDSTCGWARGNVAYGDFGTDASCALVERTNQGFGSVTTQAGTLPGIVFNAPSSARYWVCANATSDQAVAGEQYFLRLHDGTNTISETNFQDVLGSTGQHRPTSMVCGIYNASAGTKTISLQARSSAGATITVQGLGGNAIEWSIFRMDQAFPAPVFSELQNKVGTPGYGNDTKVCSFYVSNGIGVTTPCSSAGCSTQKIKGGCANLGSVTRASAGRYTYTFPGGYWSSPGEVSCQVTLSSGGSGRLWPYLGNDFSTTVRDINFDNSSAVGADASFEVTCHGK